MDKEILRIVIIATGLVVIVGMLIMAYLKDKKARDMSMYDDLNANDDVTTGDDDFEVVSLGSSRSEIDVPVPVQDKSDKYFDDGDQEDDYFGQDDNSEPEPRFVAPAVIQFSIISKVNEDFNGVDLVEALEDAGLVYGSLKIFERLDQNRLVDFGVASMVEPGTFPENDLEEFYCPGVVFFMQPGELDDAQAVFDDYIDTITAVAAQVDGMVLDHRRQPLTAETIQTIRQSL
ncbi:MAG: cell division protein ZipA C-terminal FtsZ-binding domain-containing protein [Methylobacter sp.]|nr:cell division protein ZipA C-terminal FtsZ-binding domain-containing protein [Methylobacter sp.]